MSAGSLGARLSLLSQGTYTAYSPECRFTKACTHQARMRSECKWRRGALLGASGQHAPQTANPQKAYKSGCMRHEQECHRQPVMEGRWQLRCKPTKELSCLLAG